MLKSIDWYYAALNVLMYTAFGQAAGIIGSFLFTGTLFESVFSVIFFVCDYVFLAVLAILLCNFIYLKATDCWDYLKNSYELHK